MRINPETLARASSRHPWRVIGIWGVLFLVMVGVSSSLLGGVLTNDISFTNKPESIKATILMPPSQAYVILRRS